MQAPDQAKQVADSSCTPALRHAYLEAGWPPGVGVVGFFSSTCERLIVMFYY